jgi:hypothetical protein
VTVVTADWHGLRRQRAHDNGAALVSSPAPTIRRYLHGIRRAILRTVEREEMSARPTARARRWAFARSASVGILALVALVASVSWLDQRMAVQGWLSWTLLVIWGWQLLLAASLIIAGHAVVVRGLGIRPRSLVELLALAVPAGALAFAMGLFVAGFLGGFSPWFAVSWPPALAFAALWVERDRLGSLRALWRRHRPRPAAFDPAGLAITGFGLVAVALAYFKNFSPESVTYDAVWTHLTIAQDYAREGRIVPFLADWPKNLPHLGSVLNTWSFLVPGLPAPAEKWMMALHTEFVFFLWTLVAVAAAMQRLGGYRPGAWAAMFLFPAFFVYDHCLGGGADHFLAFWSVPALLALLETVATRAPRWWLMLAITLSGAVLTKLQAVLLVAPAAGILAVALLRDAIQRLRGRPAPSWRTLWLGPLLAAAAALVLTAPHFGANLVHHHNPFYPVAQGIFTGSTPTVPDADLLASYVLRNWGVHPPATFVGQARALAIAVATFPCHPHVPESGTLFAVALVLAPLLPRARQLGLLWLFALGTVVTWNLTYPQGRNLEGVLPVVAVLTGVVLVRAFRLGRLARLGLGALLAWQIVAGFDSFFANPDRIHHAVSLLRSSRDGRADKRFEEYEKDHIEIGRSLPRKAVVLLHSVHTNLGIDRPILHDWLGFQSLIDPRTFRTARDLCLRLRELGVTHVVYEPNHAPAVTRQGEAVFAVFAASRRDAGRSFGGLRVFPMPAEPPPAEPDYQVLLIGMSGQADGLYAVADLGTLEELPDQFRVRKPPKVAADGRRLEELMAQARVVLRRRNAGLDEAAQRQLADQFVEFAAYSDFAVFVRKP